MTDSVLYMNVADEMKTVPYLRCNPEDNKVVPTARENCALVYDQDDQRLVLFGGWANNYLNDIYQINISSITGPDYAIYAILPNLGPLTGKTNCEIKGEGFKNLQSYYILVKNMMTPSDFSILSENRDGVSSTQIGLIPYPIYVKTT